MPISSWSTTAGNNNAAPPNGAPEGMAPGSVNDVIRQTRADVRSWYENAQWLDFGHTPIRVDADTFTIAGDQTAFYDAGRRLKLTGSTTEYSAVLNSSYSAPNTTINVHAASGLLPTTLAGVSVGINSGTHSTIPYNLPNDTIIDGESVYLGNSVSILSDSTLSSSTTLTSVGSLIAVTTVNWYRLRAMLYFTGPSGFRWEFDYSGGLTASFFGYTGSVNAAAVTGQTTFANRVDHATISTPGFDFLLIEGTFKPSSTGNIDLKFAQNASNATNLFLKRGSFFEITRTSP